MDPDARRHADVLTDRLNERREKLNYFLVTASVAVIAFTLKTALDRQSLFPGGRLILVAIGCILLLLTSGLSLWYVWTRHGQEWKYIELGLYGDDVETANTAMDKTLKAMRQRAAVMVGLFLSGIGFLALAYLLAIASDP